MGRGTFAPGLGPLQKDLGPKVVSEGSELLKHVRKIRPSAPKIIPKHQFILRNFKILPGEGRKFTLFLEGRCLKKT